MYFVNFKALKPKMFMFRNNRTDSNHYLCEKKINVSPTIKCQVFFLICGQEKSSEMNLLQVF